MQNLTARNLTALEVVRLLDLKPHPEGGHYRETFRDSREIDGRPASTAIYYLLDIGETSEWHRVDATEVWLWHAGAPMVITTSPNGHDAEARHLGPDLARGSGRRSWCRPITGRPPPASAPGPW